MTTTPNFRTSKMPSGRLAAAVMSRLFFVGLVDPLRNDSSDDEF